MQNRDRYENALWIPLTSLWSRSRDMGNIRAQFRSTLKHVCSKRPDLVTKAGLACAGNFRRTLAQIILKALLVANGIWGRWTPFFFSRIIRSFSTMSSTFLELMCRTLALVYPSYTLAEFQVKSLYIFKVISSEYNNMSIHHFISKTEFWLLMNMVTES